MKNYTSFLWDRMQQLHDCNPISTHTPGHKNGLFLPETLRNAWGDAFASYDYTELPGLDNLHFSEDCIAESQQQAADIFGAGQCFYLVNGTTAGLQAAIMTTCTDKKVFVPRHVHRSIYHSMLLARAIPVYLPLELDERTGLPLGISPEILEKAIMEHPDCKNLILVNPTYQGITGENVACVQMAKRHGLTVIVDEAHGSHLHFHESLPASLLDAGADLVVQSWHKTLPVMTQGSALLVNKTYTGPSPAPYLSVLQTTSPSYLLMASLEQGSITMGEHGRENMEASLAHIYQMHSRIAKELSCLQLLWHPEWHQDPFKLYLLTDRCSGSDMDAFLREHCRLYSEMQDASGILFILPLQLTEAWCDMFWDALLQLDNWLKTLPEPTAGIMSDDSETSAANRCCDNLPEKNFHTAKSFYCKGIPEQCYPLHEAFVMKKETLCWKDAAERIAGQFILRYPPGIPLLVPGEKITREIVDLWLSCGGSENDLVTVLAE